MLLAVFVVPMSVAGTAVAIPAISTSLGTSTGQLQWVTNAFNVTFAVTTLAWGAVADRLGHRFVLRLGAGAFILGAALSAAATSLLVLDIARVLAGAGAAALLIASTGLLSATLTGRPRTQAFAAFGVVMGVGLAVGPTVAGALVDAVGWRAAFAALGVVVLIGIGSCGHLPRTAVARTTRGTVTVRMLLPPRFIAICGVPMLHAVGCIALLTYLPLVLRSMWGLGPAGAGLAMLIMTGPLLAASAIGPVLLQHGWWTTEQLISIALCALLTGDALLLFADTALPALIVAGMVLIGVGFGLPLGVLDGAALAAAPAHAAGLAAGVFNLVRLGAEALAVAAFGFALSAAVRHSAASEVIAQRILSGTTRAAGPLDAAFTLVQGGVVVVVVVGGAVVILLLRQTRTTMPSDALPSPLSRALAATGREAHPPKHQAVAASRAAAAEPAPGPGDGSCSRT